MFWYILGLIQKEEIGIGGAKSAQISSIAAKEIVT